MVVLVGHKKSSKTNHFVNEAINLGFDVFQPVDVNDQRYITKLKLLAPDFTILAGYGPLVKRDFISIAKYGKVSTIIS